MCFPYNKKKVNVFCGRSRIPQINVALAKKKYHLGSASGKEADSIRMYLDN